MKTVPLVAASALLGFTAAGVLEVKLEKIPFDQQFASVKDHTRALAHKYSQKALIRGTEQIFGTRPVAAHNSVEVPIGNGLNSQCIYLCGLP